MNDIDPIFFRKMAKVWCLKYAKTKAIEKAIIEFAEFIDQALNSTYEEKN